MVSYCHSNSCLFLALSESFYDYWQKFGSSDIWIKFTKILFYSQGSLSTPSKMTKNVKKIQLSTVYQCLVDSLAKLTWMMKKKTKPQTTTTKNKTKKQNVIRVQRCNLCDNFYFFYAHLLDPVYPIWETRSCNPQGRVHMDFNLHVIRL